MNLQFFILNIFCLTYFSCNAFFLFKEKCGPKLLCHICPLYCSHRRYDADASSLSYIEDEWPHDIAPSDYDTDEEPIFWSKPKKPEPEAKKRQPPKHWPTTHYEDHKEIEDDTIKYWYPKKPVSTTEKPKSNDWSTVYIDKGNHGAFEIEQHYRYIFKPYHSTTPAPTTTMPTTTTESTGICEFCMKKCNFPPAHYGE